MKSNTSLTTRFFKIFFKYCFGGFYTSDIYYHGVDTTSSSFKKEQCDYPDPLE